MNPRFYIPEPTTHAPLHNLFFFKYAPELLVPNVFGEPPFPNFFESAAQTDSLQNADAILLPNNFNALSDESRAYIARYAKEGEKRNIPVYVFSFGDYSHKLHFDPRVRVFLMSAYKSSLRPNDVLVPTTARTFDTVERSLRKKQDIPVVSFCGFAGLKSPKQWIKYHLKNLGWNFAGLFNPFFYARKAGIYWRRKAMRALELSPVVRTRFIVRRSFSGAGRTIELSPAAARKEFIDSIVDADFVLTPKGDGNYSNRFLEALSLGRIPVLIDTDVLLPLEDTIPYEKIVVRVPMNKVAVTPKYVRDFYDSLTEAEWQERQKLARSTFLEHLEQSQFFRNYFPTET